MDANSWLRRSGSILMSLCWTLPCPGLTASKPRANSGARSVLPASSFLTVYEDADYARVALDAGGLGYVVKTRLASDLLPAIRAALADQSLSRPPCLEEARLTPPDFPEKPTPAHRKS